MSESALQLVPPPTEEERKAAQKARRVAKQRRYLQNHPEQRDKRRANARAAWAALSPEEKARIIETHRARAKADPARTKALNKIAIANYNARHPGRKAEFQRRLHLRKRYDLTLEAFDALMQVQDGRCAICRCTFDDGPRRPGRNRRGVHVDHDHATGRVRGLLCAHCNRGLGGFQDNPEVLVAAAAYVRPKEPK